MTATSVAISVFVGECDGKDYAFALTADSAMALVKTHYAFDDPANSDYGISEVWATSTSDAGWRIREDKVVASVIIVKVACDDGTGHVNWTCPYCQTAYSDDWSEGDSLPALLMCGCTVESKFLIGEAQKER